MVAEWLWTPVLVLFLTGLVVPLLRRQPVVVPLASPLTFLAAEIVVLEWLWQGGWTAGVRWTTLICFVFVGCMMIQQSFGRRRWFVFRGGGFRQEPEIYDMVAQAIRESLQETRLPPATVICRYDGWLGLTPLAPETEHILIKHLDDALADSKWQRFGIWHLFFGVQWAVLCVALIRQFVELRGGV
ncbi:MAG: hypothetical protein UDG94_09625 [Peptococcaceae bacterium]|nr:hypothetical protein [Peptococcaceae bacterium]